MPHNQPPHPPSPSDVIPKPLYNLTLGYETIIFIGVIVGLHARGYPRTASTVSALGLLYYAVVFFRSSPLIIGLPLAIGCLSAAKRLAFPPPPDILGLAPPRAHNRTGRPVLCVLAGIVFIFSILAMIAQDVSTALGPVHAPPLTPNGWRLPSRGLHIPLYGIATVAGFFVLSLQAMRSLAYLNFKVLMDGCLSILLYHRIFSVVAQYVFTGFAFWRTAEDSSLTPFLFFANGWIASAVALVAFGGWVALCDNRID